MSERNEEDKSALENDIEKLEQQLVEDFENFNNSSLLNLQDSAYALGYARRKAEQAERMCMWIDNGHGEYQPSCGGPMITILPFPFCQFCGGKIRVIE